MLWLALAARNSGTRASAMLGVQSEVAALDLDLAASVRLQQWENERRDEDFKRLAALLGAEV